MGFMRHSGCAGFLRRLTATGCIALVFALGLLAASPTLHEQLHHDAAGSAEDGCAIVLFANGVPAPLVLNLALPLLLERGEPGFRGAPELMLDSPRYRLQPGRGPPVG